LSTSWFQTAIIVVMSWIFGSHELCCWELEQYFVLLGTGKYDFISYILYITFPFLPLLLSLWKVIIHCDYWLFLCIKLLINNDLWCYL
jgi:hypothetical protein